MLRGAGLLQRRGAGAADGRGRSLHGRAGHANRPGRAACGGVPGCAQPRLHAARHALRWGLPVLTKEGRRKRATEPITAPLLQEAQTGCIGMRAAGGRRAPAGMQSVAGEELPSAYQLPPGRAAECAQPACLSLYPVIRRVCAVEGTQAAAGCRMLGSLLFSPSPSPNLRA
jgi:hypothetical protein